MSFSPCRLQGRLLSSKHCDTERTRDGSDGQFFPSSPTTSPQNHHHHHQHQHPHQHHQNGRQQHKMRMKAILLAAVAAAVMGGFTVASSGLLRKRPPSVGAVSPSAVGRGRDSEQLLVGPSTTPPHGISATGNPESSIVAGPTIEHAAQKQHHELILAPSKRGSSRLQDFPPLEESTVMFLHVFKCAGSTLRRMMVAWAEEEGQSGAIVIDCGDLKEDGTICLRKHKLLDPGVQEKHVAKQKVLAGHFLWGFQRHVRTPYLMITALRNPLEVFVSAQQFMHRKQTQTLEEANGFVSWCMAKRLRYEVGTTPGADFHYQKAERPSEKAKDSPEQLTGYIHRFIGVHKKNLPGPRLEMALKHAMENMDTFWVVGVVEQYAGFEAVLMRLLDPKMNHRKLWEAYAVRQYNTSPVKTTDILSVIDPGLVQEFNGSLALQWRLYEKSLELWDGRCREVLPTDLHQDMCAVPSAPQQYIPTQPI